MNFRECSIYITRETQFYAGLRRKQLIGDNPAQMTIDEIICNDLRNLWTTQNPKWVIAWEGREECRAQHKKNLDAIEMEALK